MLKVDHIRQESSPPTTAFHNCLACLSCESLKMQASLPLLCFVVCVRRPWRLKIRIATQRRALFCEETLGKIDAKDIELFRNGLSHEFYRLKVLMTLDKLNTSVESFVVYK